MGAPRTEATSTKYKLSTAARKTQDSKRQVRDDTEHRVQLLTFYIAILAVYGTDCTELSVPLVYSRSVNKPNGAGAVWVRAWARAQGRAPRRLPAQARGRAPHGVDSLGYDVRPEKKKTRTPPPPPLRSIVVSASTAACHGPARRLDTTLGADVFGRYLSRAAATQRAGSEDFTRLIRNGYRPSRKAVLGRFAKPNPEPKEWCLFHLDSEPLP